MILEESKTAANSIFHEEKNDFCLNEETLKHIKETAQWAKFLSIIGFIFIGLMIILGVVMIFVIPTLNQKISGLSGTSPMVNSVYFSVFYFILAAVYFFPVLYLFRFSNQSLKALKNKEIKFLAQAFKQLKNHFKFVGILVIISFSFYVLAILGIMIGGLLGSI